MDLPRGDGVLIVVVIPHPWMKVRSSNSFERLIRWIKRRESRMRVDTYLLLRDNPRRRRLDFSQRKDLP
jgi:hypothetical protein